MKWLKLCPGCGFRRVHLYHFYGGLRCRSCMIRAGLRVCYRNQRAAPEARRPAIPLRASR